MEKKKGCAFSAFRFRGLRSAAAAGVQMCGFPSGRSDKIRGSPSYRYTCVETYIYIDIDIYICIYGRARTSDTKEEGAQRVREAPGERGRTGGLDGGPDLEESLEVEDLEEGVEHHDDQLDGGPVLDPGVGRLGGVSVRALSDDDVVLLVLDVVDELEQLSDAGLQVVVGVVVDVDVDNAVDVEGDVLGLHVGVLVGEAVEVLAGLLGLDVDRAVGGVREGLDHLARRRLHPEVAVQLLRGVPVSVADLERDRELVLRLQRLVEALFPPWRQQRNVRMHQLCEQRRHQQQQRG